MKLTLSLFAIICLLAPAALRADEASHRQAAEALLTQMDMEKMMNQSVDQTLAAQVASNPQIAAFQPQMKEFLTKYMSWASLKGDIVKVYMAEFTEGELAELNKFYATPLGKKMVSKMPSLMAKGMQIGQQRVQEHLPELQAAIAGAQKK